MAAKKDPKKNMMVLNRNYVLQTLMGHSIRFRAGVPVAVPPMVRHEAVAIGALPADGSDPNVLEDDAPDSAPRDPAVRTEKVMDAVLALVAKNDSDDFTASNMPKIKAVMREAGFKVDVNELKDVWQKYHEDVAAERDAELIEKQNSKTAEKGE